jgi:RNase P/RNase MRP subunit p29
VRLHSGQLVTVDGAAAAVTPQDRVARGVSAG